MNHYNVIGPANMPLLLRGLVAYEGLTGESQVLNRKSRHFLFLNNPLENVQSE